MSEKQNDSLNNNITPTDISQTNEGGKQMSYEEQQPTSRQTLQEQKEELVSKGDDLMAKLLGILGGDND